MGRWRIPTMRLIFYYEKCLKLLILIILLLIAVSCNNFNSENETNNFNVEDETKDSFNAENETEDAGNKAETAVKTKFCNYNTICEDYEENTCKDCKCNGIVCGGICYNYDGKCCNDIFIFEGDGAYCDDENLPKNIGCPIPGTCFSANNPLIVKFDIPVNYEVGIEKSGQITIKNNGNYGIEAELDWWHNKNFEVRGANANVESEYSKISLMPGEETKVDIWIKALYDYNLFFNPAESFSRLYFGVKTNNGAEWYPSPVLNIYKKSEAIACSKGLFPVYGKCINNLYYPDAMCTQGNDDYRPICANGFVMDNNLAYDGETDKLKLSGDVPPIGTIRILTVRLNNNISIDIKSLQEWIENFFDMQSSIILGRNMVDFQFYDWGSISLDWDGVKDGLDLTKKIENSLEIQKKDYEILIGYTDKTKSKIIFNESAAVYVGKGVILADTGEDARMYYLMAHEINHAFGAPDLYFNHSFSKACSTYFVNDLMCGSSNLVSDDNYEKFKLNTAPFIGWADIDGDGITDVEDRYIMKAPSWLEGLEILEVRPLIGTFSGTNQKVFSVEGVVVDKKRKKVDRKSVV